MLMTLQLLTVDWCGLDIGVATTKAKKIKSPKYL